MTSKKAHFGSWRLKTKRKMPRLARPRTLEVGTVGGGMVRVPVLLLPGAILEWSGDPGADFGGPLVFDLQRPDGAIVDLSGAVHGGAEAFGVVAVENVQIDTCGRYDIRVHGFGNDPDATVEMAVLPFQPLRGDRKIYVP